MGKAIEYTIPPPRENDRLAEIVRDMGELFRQHVSALTSKIRVLEERVCDLEGHAEHGPEATCGVCTPETVGDGEYGPIQVADFEGDCQNPHCTEKIITPGTSVIKVDEGMYVHDYC